jgi:hypothetical protein
VNPEKAWQDDIVSFLDWYPFLFSVVDEIFTTVTPTTITPTTMNQNIDLIDYHFDLNGFAILKNAVDIEHLKELNNAFDNFPQDLAQGQWWGNVQRLDNNGVAGLEDFSRCIREVRMGSSGTSSAWSTGVFVAPKSIFFSH